jgi:hypothetical protein
MQIQLLSTIGAPRGSLTFSHVTWPQPNFISCPFSLKPLQSDATKEVPTTRHLEPGVLHIVNWDYQRVLKDTL